MKFRLCTFKFILKSLIVGLVTQSPSADRTVEFKNLLYNVQ